MTRMAMVILALLYTAVATAGLNDEKILLVKISGYDRETSYEVMTEEEYKALQDLIKTEKLLHRKALVLARDKWKENADTEKVPFPSGAVTTRHASTARTFTDEKEAKAKQRYYQDKLEQEKARDAKREEERIEQQHTRVSINLNRRDWHKVRVDKAAIAEDHARAATKAERYAQAQSIYTECLQKLVAEKLGQQ